MNRPAFQRNFGQVTRVGPQSTNGVRRAAPDKNPPLFHYFFHLKRDFTTVEDFQNQWNAIPETPFNAKDCTIILNKTAAFIETFQGAKEDQIALYNYVQENLPLWEKGAISQIETFNGQDSSLTLNAYTRFRREPSPDLREELEEQIFCNIDENDFNAQSCSLTLNAYARFGWELPEFLWKPLERQIKKQIEAFNPQEISNSLHACAVLDSIHPNSRYQKLAYFLKKNLPEYIERRREQKQIFDSFLHFNWQLPFKNPKQRKQEIKSSDELKLKKWFSQARFNTIRPQNLMGYFRRAIDFPAQKNGQILLIEFDGPTHFFKDGAHDDPDNPRYNGLTLFRSHLIHQQEPDLPILRIPWTIKMKIEERTKGNLELRSRILDDLAAQVAKKDPGIYRALYIGGDFTIGPLRPDENPRANGAAFIPQEAAQAPNFN